MRKTLLFLFSLSLIQSPSIGATSDSLSIAADYYYLRHDYRQAFQLWREVFKRQPNSVRAVMRVTELKLMFENRQSAKETALKFLEANADKLDLKAKKGLKEHIAALQKTFVSDDVQSTYLQAKPKLRYKDWAGALLLLNQALNQDPGNFSILKDKADCEAHLAQWDRFIETVKLAFDALPFDEENLDDFLEASIYKQDYTTVLNTLKKFPESFASERARLSLAYAYLETGMLGEGVAVLQSLLNEKKAGALLPPVYYALGKAILSRGASRTEAFGMFEKFTASAAKYKHSDHEGWDPYRVAEKVEEVKKQLLDTDVPLESPTPS